mgnify:CR=1 FL=1
MIYFTIDRRSSVYSKEIFECILRLDTFVMFHVKYVTYKWLDGRTFRKYIKELV